MPLGRIGEPVEMANGIVFLASEAASYITGNQSPDRRWSGPGVALAWTPFCSAAVKAAHAAGDIALRYFKTNLTVGVQS